MDSYWYNYKIGDYEYREAPVTDEDAMALIPQIPAAQGLYKIKREMGKGVIDAMLYVLEACCGVEHSE